MTAAKKSRRRKAWEMPSHPLRFPISVEDDDGNVTKLTEIKLRAFTVGEHRKALAGVSDDADEQFEALLVLASGLDQDVVEQIKRPDFVSLGGILSEYIKLPASYFLERLPEDPDNGVPLLVPIKTVSGQRDSLDLQVPALKATKIMQKLKGVHEPTDFISSHCTGLSVQEIQSLSCPDWTQLQDRLNSFLNKPADYFQTATST